MYGARSLADARDAFMQAMRFRHACREFVDQRHVPRQDMDFLLEAGRLSPSSLGLEPWRFIVVEDPGIRKALQRACMNQPQVGSASAVIIVLGREGELVPDGEFVVKMLRREAANEVAFTSLMDLYREFARHNDLAAWSIAQCHIAAANIMTAAAFIGVDTCPIGAFSSVAVMDVLGIPSGVNVVALLVAVGYRKHAPAAKQRLPMEELVEYRYA